MKFVVAHHTHSKTPCLREKISPPPFFLALTSEQPAGSGECGRGSSRRQPRDARARQARRPPRPGAAGGRELWGRGPAPLRSPFPRPLQHEAAARPAPPRGPAALPASPQRRNFPRGARAAPSPPSHAAETSLNSPGCPGAGRSVPHLTTRRLTACGAGARTEASPTCCPQLRSPSLSPSATASRRCPSAPFGPRRPPPPYSSAALDGWCSGTRFGGVPRARERFEVSAHRPASAPSARPAGGGRTAERRATA